MAVLDELYRELKPDIAVVAEPLFDFSAQCLRERGAFLPHAVILTAGGTLELVGATSESADGQSAPADILPILHAGLRKEAKEKDAIALGVAEHVTVTQPGRAPTQAIKVLFEHRRGLVVALYLPFAKRFLRGYSFGETFSTEASGEVNAWSQA
jgi:hypothetical protein